MSERTWGRLERGETMPTLLTVLQVAHALNITGADLVATIEARLPPDFFK